MYPGGIIQTHVKTEILGLREEKGVQRQHALGGMDTAFFEVPSLVGADNRHHSLTLGVSANGSIEIAFHRCQKIAEHADTSP
jgi:hypothetical protein